MTRFGFLAALASPVLAPLASLFRSPEPAVPISADDVAIPQLTMFNQDTRAMTITISTSSTALGGTWYYEFSEDTTAEWVQLTD